VPVAPTMPPARIEKIIANLGPAAIITDSAHIQNLGDIDTKGARIYLYDDMLSTQGDEAVMAKIVDNVTDQNTQAKPGECGEICILGSGLAHTNMLYRRPITPGYSTQQKAVYYGAVSDEKLLEDEQRMPDNFSFPPADCEANLSALQELICYCSKHNIRLRALWMPQTPKVVIPPFALAIMDAANTIFVQNGVEVLDYTNEIEAEYFYDIGHLDYETGALHFKMYG